MNISCLQTDPLPCLLSKIQSFCVDLRIDELKKRYGVRFREDDYIESIKKIDPLTDFTRFWIVWDGEKVVGTVGIVCHNASVTLHKMFVADNIRQQEKNYQTLQEQKTSHRLMMVILNRCERNTIASINLETANPYAVKFYQKYGFVLSEPIPEDKIGCVGWRVRMEKGLLV